MKEYSKYTTTDFLLDDSFVKWVKSGCSEESHWSVWTLQHSGNEQEFTRAKEIILSAKIVPVRKLNAGEIKAIVDRVNERIETAGVEEDEQVLPRKTGWMPWLKVAAAVLLIASITTLLYNYNAVVSGSYTNENAIEDVNIVIREAGVIKLPDGTSVLLKQGSSIQYPQRFTKHTRQIHLQGEAYFEVKKESSRPFIVNTDEMVIRVLGTSFFVRAYKTEKQVSVTVTTGKVSVVNKNHLYGNARQTEDDSDINKKEILLVSNQELILNKGNLKLKKLELSQPLALSQEVAKTTFNFVETPFSEAIGTVSKAYDIPIIYDENIFSDCPLTASLTNQSFYEKLTLICKAVEATFVVQDGKIVIKGKGCKIN
ncbi:FecR family protein [Arcticibacter tournemirensis]|uniref:FecR family protein n=1 Tax=Arcticibacter tournemirensis TaxID=699437 RepID=A0A4Q0MGQ5_9SPHI|nr:FecR family protein [Arcticibacter tournemirensis]RXF72443.1 FecR family protein [Arcticibacter tournemirensis]